MTDREKAKHPVLRIRDLFSTEKRPEHFTDVTHCEECADHDGTLQNWDNTNLPSKVVTNPGWNPIPFLTPEGYRYYYPRLCELAYGTGENYFLDSFLGQLEYRLDLLSQVEKEATRALLIDIAETLQKDILLNLTGPDIDRIAAKLVGYR